MHAPQRVLASLSLALIMGLVLTTTSCTGSSASTGGSTSHAYNGTASVGDFYTIAENDTANTITYTDVTNGLTGTVPFTTTDNIHYTLTDPTGNLLKAIAIPGYAMMLESQKSGSNSSTKALITAVESGPINLTTLPGSYNFMQFRTAGGGPSTGSVILSSSTISNSGYSPYGATAGGSNAYSSVSQSTSGTVVSPSGTYLTAPPPLGGTVFGTVGTGATLIVDTGFGSILGMQKASSAAFQTTNAGTYTGVVYGKTGAVSIGGGTETGGTVAFTDIALTLTSTGVATLTNTDTSTVISTGTLIPVSTANYFYNGTSSEVTDPCYGLFTYRVTVPGVSQTDVFVSFGLGGSNTVTFEMFTAALPLNSNSPYNYMYGVAVP
jgi:hypothetical protein